MLFSLLKTPMQVIFLTTEVNKSDHDLAWHPVIQNFYCLWKLLSFHEMVKWSSVLCNMCNVLHRWEQSEFLIEVLVMIMQTLV